MVYPCFEGLNFKRKQILSMYTHTHTHKKRLWERKQKKTCRKILWKQIH